MDNNITVTEKDLRKAVCDYFTVDPAYAIGEIKDVLLVNMDCSEDDLPDDIGKRFEKLFTEVIALFENPKMAVAKTRTKNPDKVKYYRTTGNKLGPNQSLPKQAQLVLDALEMYAIKNGITLTEWTEAAVRRGLETKQPPERIVMYYRPMLLAANLIEECEKPVAAEE